MTVAIPSHASPVPETEPQPGILALVAEDVRTYDRDFTEVGLWVTVAHRFRGWAAQVPVPLVGTAVRAATGSVMTAADWFFGIRLPADVQLGRRVRIWHHGCIRLGARAIGDDVHIRPNTTFGPAPGAPDEPAHRPVIGDKADIGAGASVLGPVAIGSQTFVGANSLVLIDVPAGGVVLGVPGRMLPKRRQ